MKEENNKIVSLDTMAYIGKKKTIAGREYEIAPVNIKDMHYIIGDGDDKLIIVDKEKIESNELSWQIFGLNIIEENRKKVFLEILNKYVKYKEKPMSEELLIEHNWSFKEIGEFIYVWSQISD